MSAPAFESGARRPQLRLIHSDLRRSDASEVNRAWRRVAAAVVASTSEIWSHLREQRWSRVHEELSERRELLELMRTMPLDADGRSCLRALQQAARESDRAIASMAGETG